METIYELRVKFGEEAQDIIASEHDESSIMLEQGNDMILVSKSSAASFADSLLTWISLGGKPCAS